MALNIRPFEFGYQSNLRPAQNITQPGWGPPDMSKQLQEGIAAVLPNLMKQYDDMYTRRQSEKTGQKLDRAEQLASLQGQYAPVTGSSGTTTLTGGTGPSGGTGSSGGAPLRAGGIGARGPESLKPFQTQDPVAGDLTPEQRAMLNGIAGPESGGKYNIRYTPQGGATFDLGDQHPGIFEPTTGGKKSSAAGRYQFTKTTWDGLTGGNVPFTPENQDRMAVKLAQRDYAARTGRNLDADLQAEGFSPRIQAALKPTWAGIAGGNSGRVNATYQESLQRYASGGPAQPANAPPVPGTFAESGVQPRDTGAGPVPTVVSGQPAFGAGQAAPAAAQGDRNVPDAQTIQNAQTILKQPNSTPAMKQWAAGVVQKAGAQAAPQAGISPAVQPGAPQAVAAAAPGVVPRSGPTQQAVSSAQNQPPLFSTPQLGMATGAAQSPQQNPQVAAAQPGQGGLPQAGATMPGTLSDVAPQPLATGPVAQAAPPSMANAATPGNDLPLGMPSVGPEAPATPQPQPPAAAEAPPPAQAPPPDAAPPPAGAPGGGVPLTYRDTVRRSDVSPEVKQYLSSTIPENGVDEKGDLVDAMDLPVDLERIVLDPNAGDAVKGWAQAEIERQRRPPPQPATGAGGGAATGTTGGGGGGATGATGATGTTGSVATAVNPAMAQTLSRIGVAPQAMADLSPYMIGALAQAIRSGDPTLINGTVGAVNAITQARQAGSAGSADWSYERDPKTGRTIAFNKRTTESRELDPGRTPGSVDLNTDRIIQPTDPDYHKYAPKGDTRPWRLTTDDKGNVKPEPVTESPEFDQSTKLAEKIEANPQYKTYQAGSSALDVLHSNLNEGTPEADLAGIFSFMKSLDPVSAVREGEQDAMRGASGPFAGLWAQYNKLVGSGAFTPEQRQRFYNTAVESLKAQGQGAQNAVDEQRRRAEAFKIDPNKVSTWKPRDLKRVEKTTKDPETGQEVETFRNKAGFNQNKGQGEVGRSESKPIVVKKTFKTAEEAAAYLAAVGDVKPGYYEVTVEGRGKAVRHAGQEP